MKQYQDVKLSGLYAILMFWAGILFIFPMLGLLFYAVFSREPITMNEIGFGVFFTIITLIFLWVWVMMSKAEIKNNKLHLTKFFRPTKVYDLSEVVGLKTFGIGKTDTIKFGKNGVQAGKESYNWLTVEKHGVKEHFVIIAQNIHIDKEPVDTQQMLKDIFAESKKLKNQV
ncbi:hypothetical protein PG279_01385 [Riemerella anatipestifer]|nr:hypothetical protein [Riemerella anatipestifer]